MAHETISELFRFDIEAVATGTIDARAMLNKPACLTVNHGDKATRYFHGIVAEFGPIETSGVVDTLYRMVLVPQLAQANIRSDCRLFFNKTAEDILKTIFNDCGRDQDRVSSLFPADAPQGHGTVQRDIVAFRDPADGRRGMVLLLRA